jgi:hypothetical protein
VLHVLAMGYDEATDAVAPVRDLELCFPWTEDGSPRISLVTPDGERPLAATLDGDRVRVVVPELDPYALVVADRSSP